MTKLSDILNAMTADSNIMIKERHPDGDVIIAAGMRHKIVDNIMDSDMYSCYVVLSAHINDNIMIINVAGGDY